jgi:ribosome-associated protein
LERIDFPLEEATRTAAPGQRLADRRGENKAAGRSFAALRLASRRAAGETGRMLEITPQLAIPDDELVERFVRSSGPGGQNVNKVATAVELRFDAANSPSLPEDLRARLLARRDRRITDEGVVVISAQRFRTQERNREDARERLAALVVAALHVPKKRIATKPSRGAKERRLGAKRERGQVKSTRRARWDHE